MNIKKFLLLITILATGAATSAPSLAYADLRVFNTTDIVVNFYPGQGPDSLSNDFKISDIDHIFGNAYRVTVSSALSEAEIISGVRSLRGVDWAQADERVRTSVVPNDEFFTTDPAETNLQWYLPKIQAPRAWDIKTDATTVVVAVVDTGIHASHQDLGDGRVIAGYKTYCETVSSDSCAVRVTGDIIANSNSDDNGHGTAVASLVGAQGNNLAGISGVAWHVKLMPVKVLNKDGVGVASDVAEGIVWAAQNGAKVINLSLGTTTLADSQILTTAADIASKAGAVVVAAAGNDKTTGIDLDVTPSAPVCSDGNTNNVLGVAAIDKDDKKALFSNFGTKCIDLSAPGVKMLVAHFDATQPTLNNIYAYRSGTSFAAPLVSGAAALLISMNPGWSVTELKNRIITTTSSIKEANATACGGFECGSKLGTGRLNVWGVLSGEKSSDITPPPTPTPQDPVLNDGNIVKPAGVTDLYIIQNGKKRMLIPFVAQQRGINISNITEISFNQFNNIPSDTPLPPIDDTLIKGNQSATVYIIKDGIKRPLTYLAFVSNGFRFEGIVILDELYVSGLNLGNLYPLKSGTLIKGASSPAVYYVAENSVKQPITYFGFTSRGFDFKAVHTTDDAFVDSLITGPVLLPKSGTLMRSSAEATVYLVESAPTESLHGLSFQAFVNRGLKFSDVSTVSDGEFNLYKYAIGVPYFE